MCDDVTCEYQNLARMAGMNGIKWDDLTYFELNTVCENVVLGWMI